MSQQPTRIPAGQFKARCLQLMDDVQRHKTAIIITKRGKAVAKLVPMDETSLEPVYGCMKGTALLKEDILAPINVDWEACR